MQYKALGSLIFGCQSGLRLAIRSDIINYDDKQTEKTMTKNAFIESFISERNKKFNGVRADLQNEDIPAEIQQILDQKNKAQS